MSIPSGEAFKDTSLLIRTIRVIACVAMGNVVGLISVPAAADWYRAERLNSILIYTPAMGRTWPLLSIECKARETSVTIYWRQRMAGGYSQVITYEIDNQRRRAEQWRLSADGATLGLWGASAIPFVFRLQKKNKLIVHALTIRGAPVVVEFELAGMERAIVPVAKACRWPRQSGWLHRPAVVTRLSGIYSSHHRIAAPNRSAATPSATA